jgi:hypothetical protein
MKNLIHKASALESMRSTVTPPFLLFLAQVNDTVVRATVN